MSRHVCAIFHGVLDLVRSHPLVLIGGLLHQNPFFLPPDQFLRERRAERP